MGVLLFILCLVLGFAAGYLYRDTFGGRKQVGGDNCIQIQTEEILLDAECNKEISDITSSHDDSHKNRLLNDLTKRINESAQNGQTHIDLSDNYDLNKKINEYLTKKEIEEYFGSRGYQVTFVYCYLNNSDISRINWE